MQPRFNEQIKQIIPAHQGYYAVLLDAEEPYYRLERIVGWALVEFEDADSERQTRIVGLSLFSSGVWFADNTKEFFEYVHEDQLEGRQQRFRDQGMIYADGPEGYGNQEPAEKEARSVSLRAAVVEGDLRCP